MPRHEGPAFRVRRILLQRLECLQRAGVVSLPHIETGGRRHAAAAAAGPTTDDRQAMETGDLRSEKTRLLAELQQEVATCTVCSELAEKRTQTVFGVGNPQAELCFFGEAPGADEDRLGEPFVGRAGRLLTDMIEKGMGLRRSDVYILNVLKCRPPGNRNPNGEEIDACRHFYERQFEVIQPNFICCLGSVAAQTLLDTRQTVGRLRGTLHDYHGVPVLVTYHPAYLLRNPAAKKEAWRDLKLLMETMGIPVPEK